MRPLHEPFWARRHFLAGGGEAEDFGALFGTATAFSPAEATAIREALTRHGGNRTRTAQDLGISRNTLWRKMKKLGIS